jgi:hypothetical protein
MVQLCGVTWKDKECLKVKRLLVFWSCIAFYAIRHNQYNPQNFHFSDFIFTHLKMCHISHLSILDSRGMDAKSVPSTIPK